MRHPDNSTKQLWYTRRGDAVQGPFPAGLVTRFIILGRIRPTDELSTDQKVWVPLKQLPELIPELMRSDLNDPALRQRLQALQRWEDERGRHRRRDEGAEVATDRRECGERRTVAVAGARRRHRAHEDTLATHIQQRRRHRLASGLIAVGVAAFLGALVLFYRPVSQLPEAGLECFEPPRPGVDWSNCSFEGRSFAHTDLTGAHMKNMRLSRADFTGSRLDKADLSYSELAVARLQDTGLRDAILVGASLRGADLARADLSGSDLSYADLRGADLTGANLSATMLGNALWTDGRFCAPGSVGNCLSGSD